MEMIFHLDADIFDLIENGSKDVEVRLYDEKRQQLKIGDELLFLKRPDDIEKIRVRVVDLKHYNSLVELVDNYEMKRIYYEDCNKEDYILEMQRFYSISDQEKYGVLAIEFKKE